MTKQKDLVIFNINFAQEIIRAGHNLKNVAPSKSDTTKTVFFFENTEEIRELLTQLRGK